MGVYSLPKTLESADKMSQLIERHKAFRLLSLKLSPESFGSTYEKEEAFPEEIWIKRVCGPLSTNIVAVTGNPPNGTEEKKEVEADVLLREEWLASLTLSGPFNREAASNLFKNNMWIEDPAIVMDDKIEWYFALFAMYVKPSARGSGLGAALVDYAQEKALELVSEARARIVLVVDSDNLGARRTYGKCRFDENHSYWFDDYRPGRSGRTQSSVMKVDIGGSGSPNKSELS